MRKLARNTRTAESTTGSRSEPSGTIRPPARVGCGVPKRYSPPGHRGTALDRLLRLAALPPPDLPQGGDGVRVRRGLVRPIALDPGEPEREAAGILRARLEVVECDLHHQLRTD